MSFSASTIFFWSAWIASGFAFPALAVATNAAYSARNASLSAAGTSGAIAATTWASVAPRSVSMSCGAFRRKRTIPMMATTREPRAADEAPLHAAAGLGVLRPGGPDRPVARDDGGGAALLILLSPRGAAAGRDAARPRVRIPR